MPTFFRQTAHKPLLHQAFFLPPLSTKNFFHVFETCASSNLLPALDPGGVVLLDDADAAVPEEDRDALEILTSLSWR